MSVPYWGPSASSNTAKSTIGVATKSVIAPPSAPAEPSADLIINASSEERFVRGEEKNKDQKIKDVPTQVPLNIPSNVPSQQKQAENQIEKIAREIVDDIKCFKELILANVFFPRPFWYQLFTNSLKAIEVLEKSEDEFIAFFIWLRTIGKAPNNSSNELQDPKERARRLLPELLSKLQTYFNTPPQVRASYTQIQSYVHSFLNTMGQAVECLATLGGTKNDKSIESVMNQINAMKEKNSKKKFLIVITGLEKSAKSTLSNCLIGFDLLPSKEARCTFVPTYIESSTELKIEVFFNTESEMEDILKESKDRYTEEEKAYIKKNFQPQTKQVITGSPESIKKDLWFWAADRMRLPYVKSVTVKTHFGEEYALDTHILDLPGTDSTFDAHRVMAESHLQACDAFIFSTDASRPDLTLPALSNLTFVRQNYDESKPFSTKAFAIGTKLDNSLSIENANQNRIDCTKGLVSVGFAEDRIYFGCPIWDLVQQDPSALSKENFEDIKSRMAKIPFLQDGVSDLKRDLYRMILKFLTVLDFISEVLPLSRYEATRDIYMKEFRPLLEALEMEILPGGAEALEFKLPEEYGSLFEARKNWKTIMSKTNQYRYQVVIGKCGEIESNISKIFREKFDGGIPRAENYDEKLILQVQYDKLRAAAFGAIKSEIAERERLHEEMIQLVIKSAYAAADELFRHMESILDFCRKSIVPPNMNIHSADFGPFSFEKAVTREQFRNEVKGAVMFFAVIIADACLLHPRRLEERDIAEAQLKYLHQGIYNDMMKLTGKQPQPHQPPTPKEKKGDEIKFDFQNGDKKGSLRFNETHS